MLLLLLDLLLMLLGEILEEILLEVVVGDRGVQLLTQGEGLLLMGKRFRCGFDLRLYFLTLQLLELQFELGEWLLLVRRVIVLR